MTAAGLLAPRGIAVVGASESSVWARSLLHNLDALGGVGVHLVHPGGGESFGRPVARSVTDLAGGAVDTTFVLVGASKVAPVLHEAAAAGIRQAVVLASGFAEAGPEGAARQAELVELAGRLDLTVLGPNSIGLLNRLDGIGMIASGLTLPEPGGVALVSQSGGMARAILRVAVARGVGVSHVVTTGNESVIGCAEVVDALVADGRVRAVALFAESLRRPRDLLDAARRARSAGVPVVLLKAGRSAAGQRVSAAHTGGLANDHAVAAGLLRQHGIVEVDSFEDLVATTDLLARPGALRGQRVVFLSPSGGRCTLIADRAHAEGVDLPDPAAETKARIDAVLGAPAAVHNPLDVTGAFVTDPTVFRRLLDALADDPTVDTVVVALDVPDPGTPAAGVLTRLFTDLAEVSRDGRMPVLLMETTYQEDTPQRVAQRRELGIDYALPGVLHGMSALAAALRWSRHADSARAPDEAPATGPGPVGDLGHAALPEAAARDLLAAFGVPFVPARLAPDAATAVAAARELGYPVAVKVNAAGLAHKSDAGGVALDLRDDAAVADAYDRVLAAGGPAAEGVLVAPLRSGGVELIVGVVEHPDWGQLLTVGLGGTLTEVLADSAWRRLPVTAADVGDMLGELRASALLDGGRHLPPADRDAVTAAVLAIAAAGRALRGRADAVEVNPLFVSGSRVEGLDALVLPAGGA